jgi:chemotaxis protein MotB
MGKQLAQGASRMSDQPPLHQEIIIVRRGGGDDLTAPKGGSWKIAYADFVTAMMAFFLVMWLINSANEATRAKVASYFNPIKMTDTTPSGRGLKDSVQAKVVAGKLEKDAEAAVKPGEKAEETESFEAKLMSNPQAALDEIAGEATLSTPGGSGDIRSEVMGDPFDPKAWESLRNGEAPRGLPKPLEEQPTGPQADAQLRSSFNEEGLQQPDPQAANDKSVATVRRKIEEFVKLHTSELDVFLTVDRTEDGLLIKLGDNAGSGMFAVGSAKPQASLITLVGLIGKLLAEQQGDVIVSGHTDRRPYKAGAMDNWQLSTARAHVARYMLMRGGLPEGRIRKMEGHGAASPLRAGDPLADANRRVEFLLLDPAKMP